ncbi:hypothetical protein BK026_16215 [Alteromonas sp. V450]|uniref:hypothetical protein n=1 Tax=Alteromonas sp. V450 TaxID=1912139 RepID=UPI0008FF7151|nr:hypothetical protein [Alteromonas sp. V450]OJF70195.1 hypothetical protein BK026_16215 [Alteromonas sp. V450]
MELFNSTHGLLFTMTSITPSFFAPQRSIEHHALAKKMAWRPLLISGCAHIFVVIVVVILSQLSIDDKKARVSVLKQTPEISARLYYPPALRPAAQAEPQDIKTVDVSTEKQEIRLKLDVTQTTEIPDSKNKTSENPVAKQQKDSGPEIPQVPIENKPTITPPTLTLSKDANRRAGKLNLSVKDGTAQYLDKYHSDRIAQDAKQAASDFQERKNSPVLYGPSTQQIQATENKRPSKRVNCSSSINKTLAILSSFAKGTLKCTKMDDHKRFIDSRVKKVPEQRERN